MSMYESRLGACTTVLLAGFKGKEKKMETSLLYHHIILGFRL